MMPGFIYKSGHVGIISRSGTLTHEISSNLTYQGIGQSSCICIGGDICKGSDFVDILELFRDDEETRSVIIIGEIGGASEESAADYLMETPYPKKVIAYIAGRNMRPMTKKWVMPVRLYLTESAPPNLKS
jgi:succinyl-CoA synthetase alpha subunit